MAYQRILVPFDGSEHAISALDIAKGMLSASDDARLFVVNVVPVSMIPAVSSTGPAFGTSVSIDNYDAYSELFEKTLNECRDEMLEAIGDSLSDVNPDKVQIEAVANPSPVHELADYADTHDCDIIVMGRRGLGAFRGLLGSVSYGVLRAVDIPVLTVK